MTKKQIGDKLIQIFEVMAMMQVNKNREFAIKIVGKTYNEVYFVKSYVKESFLFGSAYCVPVHSVIGFARNGQFNSTLEDLVETIMRMEDVLDILLVTYYIDNAQDEVANIRKLVDSTEELGITTIHDLYLKENGAPRDSLWTVLYDGNLDDGKTPIVINITQLVKDRYPEFPPEPKVPIGTTTLWKIKI